MVLAFHYMSNYNNSSISDKKINVKKEESEGYNVICNDIIGEEKADAVSID